MARFFVCGDCRAELVARGATLSSAPEIDLGQPCQVHRGSFAPQATSAIEAPAAIADQVAIEALSPPRFAAEALPAAVGPLTEISARLIAAWSTHEHGARVCDPVTVRLAVDTARLLLAETGGR